MATELVAEMPDSATVTPPGTTVPAWRTTSPASRGETRLPTTCAATFLAASATVSVSSTTTSWVTKSFSNVAFTGTGCASSGGWRGLLRLRTRLPGLRCRGAVRSSGAVLWASGPRIGLGLPVAVGVITHDVRSEAHPDTGAQLAGFTELAATAIANAQARAELAASRARIVAAADAARRRIQRNLHDGAQQRLVTLSLGLQEAQAAPPGADELARRLEGAVAEVADVLEELKEIARGLHPAVLTDSGLRPALKLTAGWRASSASGSWAR
jgi:signal transduction histidine kinase